MPSLLTSLSRPRCGRAKNIVLDDALLLPYDDLISGCEDKPQEGDGWRVTNDGWQYDFNLTS